MILNIKLAILYRDFIIDPYNTNLSSKISLLVKNPSQKCHHYLNSDKFSKFCINLMKNIWATNMRKKNHNNTKKASLLSDCVYSSLHWRIWFVVENIIGIAIHLCQMFLFVFISIDKWHNTMTSYKSIGLLSMSLISFVSFLWVSCGIFRMLVNWEIISSNIDQLLIKDMLLMNYIPVDYQTGKNFIESTFYGKNNKNMNKIRRFIQIQLFYKYPEHLKSIVDDFLNRCQMENETFVNVEMPPDIVKIIIHYGHKKLCARSVGAFALKLE